MRPLLKIKAKIGLLLIVIVTLSLYGCKSSTPLAQTTTEMETQEAIYIPSSDDILDVVLNQIQDEMRVFDVVAYHDPIYAEITDQAIDTKEEALRPLIESIVEDYMNNLLESRIKDVLSEYNPEYPEGDVVFIYNQVKTKDLYRLIVLYEQAYFIQMKGK